MRRAAVLGAILAFVVLATVTSVAVLKPQPATVARAAAPFVQPSPRSSPPSPAVTPAPMPNLGMADAASILVDESTGGVIYEHNAGARRAPASLTKTMTVLVALDHAQLTQAVTVPAAAVRWGPQYSTMGLHAGDVLTVRELLYGVFLASANDAAETLAQTLMARGDFIAEMNARAAAIGMTGTHFANPTGVDAAGNYSTASDLARLTAALATQHPDLLAIAQQPSVVLYATDGHPEYDLVNLNKLVTWPYPGATGLKTGLTNAAGGCVAATATRGGKSLIAIVLGDDVMFTDAAKLFDYGWTHL